MSKLWDRIKGLFGFGPAAAAVARPWRARFWPGDPLSVAAFTDPGPTPGRVGICLSGGGSRAAMGGMGQLRGLRALKTANGEDLIGQARILSTVSGGSWVGVTFEYLTPGTSDDDYLNQLVADPGRLVPAKTAGHSQAETLDQLPPGNLGNAIADRGFGPALLGIEVLLLHRFGKVPTPMLWQTAVAIHVLKPYGLFDHDRHLVPNSLFSYDAATLARDVTGPNPGLAGQAAHLLAAGAGRSRRPFLLCNLSMFLEEKDSKYQPLAPVQATPFATGVYGLPSPGTDFNGVAAGGGGVTSFAFASSLAGLGDGLCTVEQTRQLALMDIVGTSSAFYANILENLFADWRTNVDHLLDALLTELDAVLEWVEKALPGEHQDLAMAFLKHPMMQQAKTHGMAHHFIVSELKKWLDEVRDLTPEYSYWPVLNAAPASPIKATAFADGGDLENTGVASLLAYGDVDQLISFVNSSTPMAACSLGVFDAQGREVPGTRVLLDGQMPILFGYQPWQEGKGYRLYAGDASPHAPQFARNQVFPPEAFAELLQGLWRKTGNTADPATLAAEGKTAKAGANLHPAILRQELEVLPNAWFGVAGGRKVTVVWNYTNRVKAFYDALSPEVQKLVGDFEDPSSCGGWPHYSTFKTRLSPTEINLLASLTAWCVTNPADRKTFLGLFAD